MGCSSSKTAAQPRPASIADAKERAEYVGGAASGAIDVAQAILAAAPPGIADSLASAAAEYTAANAPGLAAFIGQLCGTAADLLGAIAPAIPFGGVAAAAFGKALEQGEAYALALQAARDLRKAIADRRPTIEEFAGQASLAAKHASLVGRAAQALRDAVALLAKSYEEGGRSSLRAEVWKFFTAKGGLTALQDAASGINSLADALGAAAAVYAAVRIEQVAAKQDQQLTLQEAEVARVKSKEMRAAVTAHVIARAARTGRGLLPVYGLTLEELSNAPPAAVSLWVVEATADGDAVDDTGGGGRADKPKVMQASGADAIKELLLPRPASVPGARVVIGAAGMGKTLLLNTVAACHPNPNP